ncbi:hypothetical protein pipiens_016134 [Culex pipiens pipiens]|uniref:Uncharacterized protein n=1 Tax=Culex pipiens pipiens TaxID=38569 RepID=A0ABD1CMX4_CULPP
MVRSDWGLGVSTNHTTVSRSKSVTSGPDLSKQMHYELLPDERVRLPVSKSATPWPSHSAQVQNRSRRDLRGGHDLLRDIVRQVVPGNYILLDFYETIVLGRVRNTALDANYNLGAVRFEFKLPTGTSIRHTGDFSSTTAMEYSEESSYDKLRR